MSLLKTIAEGLRLKKKEVEQPQPTPPPAEVPVPAVQEAPLDWTNPKVKVSRYFTVVECLLLPRWNVMHNPTEEEKAALVRTALVMDKVRDILGSPIKVHVWIRPKKLNAYGSTFHGHDYNALVGGATRSAHIVGLAVDWSCPGMTCDQVREKLLPHLDALNVRMEKKPGSNWVHIDLYPAGASGRYFIP